MTFIQNAFISQRYHYWFCRVNAHVIVAVYEDSDILEARMWIIGLAVAGLAILLNRSLAERVDRLEKHVRELSNKQVQSSDASLRAAATAQQIPRSLVEPVSAAAPMAQNTGAIAAGVSSEDIFFNWLKDNWLLKLGALLLLIGFGWLVSYAFLNNWIGPAGRIGLGMLSGTAIMIIGFWRIRTFAAQGGIFIALGATVMLLTTYAARGIYGFFTPASALVFMFAVSALVALASGIYNRKSLAIASVFLAGAAPMLTASATQNYIALFAYLFAVVLGSVWITVWKDYREVVLASLLIVLYYSMPSLLGIHTADRDLLLLFVYGFSAIFYVSHTAGLIRLTGKAATADLLVALGNSLLLAVWIYVAAQKEWQSLILMAWAVVFVVGAFVVFRRNGAREPLYLYAGVGLAYIAAATAIELSGAALTLAYIFEAAVLSLSLYGLTKDIVVAQRASIALAGPALLSFESMTSSAWNLGVFNEHFFVLAAMTAALFILGGMYFEAAQRSTDDVKRGNAALLIIGTLYAYILLWLSLHAAMPQQPDTAVMIALFIYTVIGVAAYVYGSSDDSSGLKAYGGTMLALVVARLMIVDVWHMALTGRIITFFLIGTLLMSTAFIGKRKQTIHADTKI